jgi:hypothetical protein
MLALLQNFQVLVLERRNSTFAINIFKPVFNVKLLVIPNMIHLMFNELLKCIDF